MPLKDLGLGFPICKAWLRRSSALGDECSPCSENTRAEPGTKVITEVFLDSL